MIRKKINSLEDLHPDMTLVSLGYLKGGLDTIITSCEQVAEEVKDSDDKYMKMAGEQAILYTMTTLLSSKLIMDNKEDFLKAVDYTKGILTKMSKIRKEM